MPVARDAGATVQDVLMAAFASALWMLGADGPLPLESVMDLRPALGPGACEWIGNFSANYRLMISPARGSAGNCFAGGSIRQSIQGTSSCGDVCPQVSGPGGSLESGYPAAGG